MAGLESFTVLFYIVVGKLAVKLRLPYSLSFSFIDRQKKGFLFSNHIRSELTDKREIQNVGFRPRRSSRARPPPASSSRGTSKAFQITIVCA
jgi:hypothetical protein